MVDISPKELRFRFQINKQLPASIAIHNPTGERVAFKVKTTAPKRYVVRPSTGVVEPRASANVQVIMQAQKEAPSDMSNCKDKFLIQVEALQPGKDIGPETFKKSEGTKLRVLIEGPPPPPSPVPEVNENEEEPGNEQPTPAAARPPAVSAPPSAALRYRPSTAAAAAVAAARASAAAMSEPASAGLSSENRQLRKQVDQLRAERDDLRRQLTALERRSSGGINAAKFSIIAIILAAALAFLVGHYFKDIQERVEGLVADASLWWCQGIQSIR